MKLYHGTTKESAREIKKYGRILAPVFLTPDHEIAAEYGETVIEVNVHKNDLMIDLDMPGSILITVDDAIKHVNNSKYNDISDFLAANQSVGVNFDIELT